MRRLRLWIVRLLLRDELVRIEREIDEEFRFHLDMKTDALVAGGMDPDEARAQAVRSFGDSERFREAATRCLSEIHSSDRRAARLGWLGQDLRDGFRQMARRPGFTLLAVGTLALGISASTAVFAYVNAYARPFPGAAARGLHQVFLASEQEPYGALSYPDFEDLASMAGGLFGVAGVTQSTFAASVRFDALTEVAFGQAVTGSFFRLLRVEMSLGRGIAPDDDRPGAPAVVVLSHDYWARRYASDPGAIGSAILLNNEPYTIVGVAGPGFRGTSADRRPQLWIPFEQYMRVYWARSDTRVNRNAGAILPILGLEGGARPPRPATR